MKKFFLSVFTVVLILSFAACSQPTPKVYTVTFDSQGGSEVVPKTQTVEEGKTVSRPLPDPSRAGYTFGGWYLTSACTGTQYNFNTSVTSDFTLYAKWNSGTQKQKWCVMAYMDFSNLTSYALDNLDEICQSTPNENAKVYILTGGANSSQGISEYSYLSKAIQPLQPGKPFAASAKADTYQFWEYTSEGKLVELTSPVKGMNDPDVLSQFIEQCYKKAKSSDPDAEFKYILELWNHGGGSYAGLIADSAISSSKQDYKEGKTLMSLADCGNTIKTFAQKNGIKFEAVIFDMCLMQSIEAAHSISSAAANYIIGSQTSSSAIGSAYTDWFNFLYQNPNATGYEFGINFCDTAYAKVEESEYESFIENITWSVLDMSKFDALEEAYEAYATSELSKVDARTVERCIDNINKNPAFDPESYIHFWEYYMYDISVFTNQIGSSAARSALMSAIKNAIVYKKYGETQENAGCCGLSMCILTDTNGWNTDWSFSDAKNTAYLEKCLSPNYRTFQKRICSGL